MTLHVPVHADADPLARLRERVNHAVQATARTFPTPPTEAAHVLLLEQLRTTIIHTLEQAVDKLAAEATRHLK